MTTAQYTLLYDGACRICVSQTQLLATYDDHGRIAMLDMNSAEAQARFPQVRPEDARREVYLVAPDGTLHRGADAVRETLLRLPLLSGLGQLMRLPGVMSLARPIYALIARNRYLLGGRADACEGDVCR
jgi:predicted DCC family thiol-disulfide oxidoreductase YuxK